MATDHNFRIKNGLDVQGAGATIVSDGSDTRITSSGEFRFRPEGSTSNKVRLTLNTVIISGSLDASANVDGNAFRIDGTTVIDSSRNAIINSRLTFGYNSHYFEAGTNSVALKNSSGNNYIVITNTGTNVTGNIQIGGTTVITSGRGLSNVTISHGSGGARFETNGYIRSTDDDSRFYFEANGRTFYRATGHQFRNSSDVTDFSISNDGHIHIGSNGDSHASSTEYIKAGGNVILSTSRHLTVASGAVSGKFAVMSTAVHGSYDFYNNGTSYFNNSVIIDAGLNLTGSNAILQLGSTTVIDNARSLININNIELGGGTGYLMIDSGGNKENIEGRRYNWYLMGMGTQTDYYKIATITISSGLYKALAMKVTVESQLGNYGHTSHVTTSEYNVAYYRSSNVQDNENKATIYGQNPVSHNLRVMKTATGTYELQIKQASSYRDALVKIQVLSSNGGSIAMSDGFTVGSSSGTEYTASKNAGAENIFPGKVNAKRFEGSADTSNTVPIFTFDGDEDTGLGYISSNAPGLIAGGSRKFYVNSTNAYFQNLSNGLEVNGADFHVQGGNANNTRMIRILHTGMTGNQTILEQNTASIYGRLHTTERQLRIEAGSSGGTGTAEKLSFWTNASRAMTIDTSQRVGIGTDAPSNLLHLKSSSDYEVYFEHAGSGAETFRLSHGTSGLYMRGPNTSNIMFGWTQDHDVTFYTTSGAKYFTGDGSQGFIGIGPNTPEAPLDIVVTASGIHNTLKLQNTNTTNNNGNRILFQGRDTSGNAVTYGQLLFKYTDHSTEKSEFQLHHMKNASSNQVLTINDSGNATFTGTINSGAITSSGQITSGGIMQADFLKGVTSASNNYLNFNDDTTTFADSTNSTTIASIADVAIATNTNDGGGGDFIVATGSSGTKRFEVSSAGAVTHNNAYTFPTSDGSANQVLQTNGSGQLSFATVTSGGGTITGVSNFGNNNRIITADGATTINAESNLTYDGTRLTLFTGSHSVNDDNAGFTIRQTGTYSDGRYEHRFRKRDEGGGIPLYIDKTEATANAHTAIVRFGSYTGNSQQFEVYGNAKVDNLEVTSGGSTSQITLGKYDSTDQGLLYLTGSTANKQSVLRCTNGNLHLDANAGNNTYINYYTGSGTYFGGGAGNVVAVLGSDGDLWKGSGDNSGSKYWHAGNDGSGSGLDADTVDGREYNDNMGVSTQHNITVDGDSDKYYPVVISGLNHEAGTEVHIERGYGETAPSDWNTSSHKGGLSLRFQVAGASGWGGYPNIYTVEEFGEIYSRICGGMKFTAHTMKFVVWLRGGTATYRIFTQKDTSLVIYDDTSSGYTSGTGWLVYDNSNNIYDVYENYRTQTQADTGAQNEIIAKMPVRAGGTTKANQVNYYAGGTTLNGGNLFWNDANDGSGSGLDADTVDGVQLANIARTDIAETFTNNVGVEGNLYIGAGSNDGYFFADINGRTAFTGGDFYLQSGVSNFYNYATNQYYGDSSGDNIYFRGNNISGDDWGITGSNGATAIGHSTSAMDTTNLRLQVNGNASIYGGNYLYFGISNASHSSWKNRITGFNTSTLHINAQGLQVDNTGYANPAVVWLKANNTEFSHKGNTIFHAGNDGSGSGLDADTLHGMLPKSATGQSGSTQILRTHSNGYLYHLNWIDIGSAGLYSSTSGPHWYPDGGNGWYARSGNANFSRLTMTNNSNTTMGYFYAESDNDIGILNNSASWLLQCKSNGNLYKGDGQGLIWHAANDGSGSGLDADLLDGQHASAFLTSESDTLNTVTGRGSTTSNDVDFGKVLVGGSYSNNSYNTVSSTRLLFGGGNDQDNYHIGTNMENYGGNYTKLDLRWHTGIRMGAQPGYGGIRFFNNEDLGSVLFSVGKGDGHTRVESGNLYFSGGTSNIAWHAGNDGSGSGLDADLLDGQEGSYYRNASNLNAGTIPSSQMPTSITEAHRVSGSAFGTTGSPGSVLEYQQAASITDTKLAPSTDWHNTIRMGHGNPYSYYSNTLAVRMTGSGLGDIYSQTISNNNAQGWNKHWHTNNDGSGSGLDADTVDGVESTSFLRSDADDTFGSTSANRYIRFNCNSGQYIASGGSSSRFPIEIFGPTTNGGDAGITFHISGDYAGFFGLASDWNDLAWGGWSVGSTTKYRIAHTGNFSSTGIWYNGNDGSGSGLDADTLDGLQPDSGNVANTIVRRNSGGDFTARYIFATHFNQSTTNSENPTIGAFWTNSTADNYNRKSTPAHVISQLGLFTTGNDGSGSGLDADTLDGEHATAFPKLAGTNTYTTNGINYFRIERGGTSGSLNTANLQVYTTGANSAFMSFHRSGAYAVNFGLDSDNVLRIGGWSASANRWVLDMSGNMTVAGDVTAFSDIRLKENIEIIPNAIEKVKQIRGITFTRNDHDDKDTRHTGVIAQEVEKVLPEVVSEDNEGVKNVAYGNMVGLLIEAMKEQQEQIEELKQKVQDLTDQK